MLALGRWRNTLQQEDIGQPHFRLSDRLSMVGVDLLASWQQTRKANNDELLSRVKSTIGSWKSGKFVPLACRPFSVNSFCLSKVWFRTNSVDLRAGDIKSLSSACKGWIYQDMFEKPEELLLYRHLKKEGLVSTISRARLLLVSSLPSSRLLPILATSSLYTTLYSTILDDSAPDIAAPPYYSGNFFSIIREVKENTPLNPVHMTVREWYRYLLEKEVTMETVDDEGRMVAKLCKVEEREPDQDWQLSFDLARRKGLSPDTKSFNFKLLHLLLPSKERLNQLLPTSSPSCVLCTSQQSESVLHALFDCDKNREAAQYLLHLVKIYDASCTELKAIRLNIHTDALYELPTILMLSTGLEFIWTNRSQKKSTNLFMIRTEMELLVCLLRKSRPRRLREAGAIIKNTLENFSIL